MLLTLTLFLKGAKRLFSLLFDCHREFSRKICFLFRPLSCEIAFFSSEFFLFSTKCVTRIGREGKLNLLLGIRLTTVSEKVKFFKFLLHIIVVSFIFVLRHDKKTPPTYTKPTLLIDVRLAGFFPRIGLNFSPYFLLFLFLGRRPIKKVYRKIFARKKLLST